MKKKSLYAFDVDLTLNLRGGPVSLEQILVLREAGNIVGLCGNWAVVTLQWPEWYVVFSFLGPLGLSKADFLRQIRQYVPADEYVMVGNDVANGISPNDALAAQEAGWRFIKEEAFADGAR